MVGSRQPRAAQPMKPRVKKRMSYDNAFKLHVVQAALQWLVDNRIKPTCACYPGIEPCQPWARRCVPPERSAAPSLVLLCRCVRLCWQGLRTRAFASTPPLLSSRPELGL